MLIATAVVWACDSRWASNRLVRLRHAAIRAAQGTRQDGEVSERRRAAVLTVLHHDRALLLDVVQRERLLGLPIRLDEASEPEQAHAGGEMRPAAERRLREGRDDDEALLAQLARDVQVAPEQVEHPDSEQGAEEPRRLPHLAAQLRAPSVRGRDGGRGVAVQQDEGHTARDVQRDNPGTFARCCPEGTRARPGPGRRARRPRGWPTAPASSSPRDAGSGRPAPTAPRRGHGARAARPARPCGRRGAPPAPRRGGRAAGGARRAAGCDRRLRE